MKTARELLRSNVKRLREKLRWTQPELAQKAGLSHQMIQKIEQEKTNPSLDTLDALTEGLHTHHADLFFDATIIHEWEKELLDLAREVFKRSGQPGIDFILSAIRLGTSAPTEKGQNRSGSRRGSG